LAAPRAEHYSLKRHKATRGGDGEEDDAVDDDDAVNDDDDAVDDDDDAGNVDTFNDDDDAVDDDDGDAGNVDTFNDDDDAVDVSSTPQSPPLPGENLRSRLVLRRRSVSLQKVVVRVSFLL